MTQAIGLGKILIHFVSIINAILDFFLNYFILSFLKKFHIFILIQCMRILKHQNIQN